MFRFALSSLPVTLRQMARVRRTGQVTLASSALALLSACGGGDRAEPYQPDRVVVFGDENSAFAPDETVGSGQIKGLVYTVNFVVPRQVYCAASMPSDACAAAEGTASAFVADAYLTLPLGTGFFVTPSDADSFSRNEVRMLALGTATYKVLATQQQPNPPETPNASVKQDLRLHYACNGDITVAQHVAHSFGKGFAECPLDNGGAKTYAAPGAKVSDLQGQVNQALAAGQLGKGALVTVWIGHNDIIEITDDEMVHVTLAAKLDQARARANSLAQVIKQIIRTGAKVVAIGVADIGYSPWAVDDATSSCGTPTKSDCASQVVNEFNDALLRGTRDYNGRGHDFAFIDAGKVVRTFAASTSYVNKRVCPNVGDLSSDDKVWPSVKPDGTIAQTSGDVQYCTSKTLVKDGNVGTYLWADERRPSWPIHEAIANAALSIAVNRF